eukprot:710635-Prymnesium_polylepis.1
MAIGASSCPFATPRQRQKLCRSKASSKRGFSCFVSGEALPGDNIADRITKNLHGAKMVIFMGTPTYGTKTTAFSTFEEMQYAQAKKKNIFPIRMLKDEETFAIPATDVYFESGVKWALWVPATPMPRGLVDQMVASLGGDTVPAAELSNV